MNNIESIIIGTVIYFFLSALCFWWTDVKKWTFRFWNYEPWTCFKCFRFWASVWTTIIIALTGEYMLALTLFVLAALDTVALHIKEKNIPEI